MAVELCANDLTAVEFGRLRAAMGWTEHTPEQLAASLKHDDYHVAARINGEAVGTGRLVGDRVMYWYLQDIIVLPEYRGQGLGRRIVEHLLDYIREHSPPGPITVSLMAAQGKEGFYEKLGFAARPNKSHGAGMDRRIIIPDKT